MEEWTMIDSPLPLEDEPVESQYKTKRCSRELAAYVLAAKAYARQPPRRFGMTISLDSYLTQSRDYSAPPAWELTRPPKVWSASNQRKVRRKRR